MSGEKKLYAVNMDKSTLQKNMYYIKYIYPKLVTVITSQEEPPD